jgi:hypothetical protein
LHDTLLLRFQTLNVDLQLLLLCRPALDNKGQLLRLALLRFGSVGDELCLLGDELTYFSGRGFDLSVDVVKALQMSGGLCRFVYVFKKLVELLLYWSVVVLRRLR